MCMDYGNHGWTFFERCVGALLSHLCTLLRIDAGMRENLLESVKQERNTLIYPSARLRDDRGPRDRRKGK